MPEYVVLEDGEEKEYAVDTQEEGRYRVTTPDGETFLVDAFEPESGRLHLLKEGESHDLDIRELEDAHEVTMEGLRYQIEVLNERERRMRKAGVGGSGGGGPDLESPMAGTVVEAVAAEGDQVDKGETVVIVEAMKMENDLKAHKAGAISAIHVEAGDSVEIGDALVSIGE